MKNKFTILFENLIRKGFIFKKISRELKETEFYSVEKLEAYQNDHLRKLVAHCFKYVPYYQDLFRRLHLTPEDIQTKEDLKKLPYLDKQILRDQFDRLKSRKIPYFLYNIGKTSGTSGIPVSTLRDVISINFENAALWRSWENAGDHSLRRVTLRGEKVVPVTQLNPPFWRYSADKNELVMSSFHLSIHTAQWYIDKIHEHKPEVIYAYPSAVYLLARYCRELKANVSVKYVFTSSEVLTESIRQYVEETFNCRIYDWYGQSERVSAIGMCEKGTYHIMEDYSITELIDFGNGPEIVGTTLHNYAMPLLRYRTGDLVESLDEKCSCGRHFREIRQIGGRRPEYIILADGNRIPSVLLEYSLDLSENVLEGQLVQERAGEIMINVTGNKLFGEADKARLIEMAKGYTSNDMVVKVNEMEKIPRGPNGKLHHFISRMNAGGEANE